MAGLADVYGAYDEARLNRQTLAGNDIANRTNAMKLADMLNARKEQGQLKQQMAGAGGNLDKMVEIATQAAAQGSQSAQEFLQRVTPLLKQRQEQAQQSTIEDARTNIATATDPNLQNIQGGVGYGGMKDQIVKENLGRVMSIDEGKGKVMQALAYPEEKKITAPTTRTVYKGNVAIQQEYQPDGTWKEVGKGPRSSTDIPENNIPIDQETIDFYASQSLSGDNSWQVGLARGKVGQRLISAVKDRIPQMAKERGMTPQDASTNKATRESLFSALKDRQKYVSAGNQFVSNFQKQADIVEKYLKPGLAGQAPAINRWIQAGRRSIAGDSEVTALDTAIRGLAREHQRIVTGVTSNAQLHVAAQQTADELLNVNMNADQVKASLKVMREEAKNAIDAGKGELESISNQLKNVGNPVAQIVTKPTQDTQTSDNDFSHLWGGQ